MINNYKWLFLISLSFIACNNDDTATVVEAPVSAGTANFSKYVALGDSFAAGYSDSALFKSGQEGSYVNVVAQQLLAAGRGDFKTPFTSDNIGGLVLGGSTIATVRLSFDGKGPVPVPGTPTTDVAVKVTGPFNNLGIPGAKSFHLISPGYGNISNMATGAANPYFVRFATTPGTTVLADAVAQSPTFFSLWIGGNDILSYATGGGIGKNQTGNTNPGSYAGNDITDPTVFAGTYSTLITSLTANNAKGVVANLPYVNTLPFFKTVPYNAASLTAVQAAGLNTGYAAYNGGLQAATKAGLITEAERLARTIVFVEGPNALVIVDEYLTSLSALSLPSYRHATELDYIVLLSGKFSASEHLGKGNGTQYPLTDAWVLSKGEVAEIKTATDAYNASIKSIADAKGLAFVDAKAIMDNLSSKAGVVSDGFSITATYATGGAFSLDGVHPSPRGYALIANAFIDAINAKYSSTIKKVDLSKYRILFPASL